MKGRLWIVLSLALTWAGAPESRAGTRLVPVAEGWAGSSVNAVVFRRNSVATHEDQQYAAFYDGEGRVTYPEFYRLPGGDLLFFYRDGGSGQGNLVLNRYDRDRRQWSRVHDVLVDGEGERNAYWRPEGTDVPQYHLVYHTGTEWKVEQVSRRTTPFRLSGAGTRRIPISRPQIVADSTGERDRAYLVFRDAERGSRVSVAVCDDLGSGSWRVEDLTDCSVGMWEPSYDTELWRRSRVLHLSVQQVGQGDGEGIEALAPQPVSILEWMPPP